MRRLQKSDIGAFASSVLLFLFLCTLLRWLFIHDNKYMADPPYGKKGVLTCTAGDLDKPLFLIDGWELYPGALYTPEDFETGNLPDPVDTFIGQYSNFSYISPSPFGTATYRLRLVIEGGTLTDEKILPISMELPEIFTDYQLWLNGCPAASQGSGTQVDTVVDGQLDIILNVENDTHYYSGLYYPPAIGTPSALAARSTARTVFYSVLCISTLTLALYCMVLWVGRKKKNLSFHFGLFCLFFCIACSHMFVWQAGLNHTFMYALEDTARIAMLAEASWIGAVVAGLDKKHFPAGILKAVLPAACGVSVFGVLILIPALGRSNNSISGLAVTCYGIFIDLCYLTGWLWLCICAAWGIRDRKTGSWFIFTGGCCLGIGYLLNFLNNNQFEPITGGWQTEYTGFVMVLVFAAMMIRKNFEILKNNRELLFHMENMVAERTGELHAVLEERKNFFSDMAHNLKAPIAAVHGFISLMREGNLYLDEELLNYIQMIEEENDQIYHRVQSLSEINAYDRITAKPETILINPLLEKVRENNEPDAGVMGIHLLVDKLDTETAAVRGQREKLLMLFENLIYNAISFTPAEGTIRITPLMAPEKNVVVIRVSDTGCGISPEHLPNIFERFYVGREDKSGGSGLGLYISRMIVEEMGGSICVESIEKEGTTFELQLPLDRI